MPAITIPLLVRHRIQSGNNLANLSFFIRDIPEECKLDKGLFQRFFRIPAFEINISLQVVGEKSKSKFESDGLDSLINKFSVYKG